MKMKADAYRQTYAGQRQRASEYGIDGAYDKIGILENAEQGDIYQHSEHTQHPAGAVALSSLLAYQVCRAASRQATVPIISRTYIGSPHA